MIIEKGGYRTHADCSRRHLRNRVTDINKKAWQGPIEPVGRDRASFMLRCTACGTRRAFHMSELKLYAVSSHRYAAGCSTRGIHSPSRPTDCLIPEPQ